MKKVLILCTGNSCRSIMAEAIINSKLSPCIKAYSSGVDAKETVNPYAINVLQEYGVWDSRYHSKPLDEIMHINFDLVVTVCDNAKELCPVFPLQTEVLHYGFEDPDGGTYSDFLMTFLRIEKELLPIVRDKLCVTSCQTTSQLTSVCG